MNAVHWGNACWFGGCTGSGPRVEADLENGMHHTNTGSDRDPGNTGVHHPFVSARLRNNRSNQKWSPSWPLEGPAATGRGGTRPPPRRVTAPPTRGTRPAPHTRRSDGPHRRTG
nr:arabinofuranosidase catalytic domain-containing protein [Streptomyces sp. SCL15-4]